MAVPKIDDSTKAKTCHQCRQKKTDLVGSCVTKKKEKTCPIKICPKCLVNRYGEIAEEVAAKDDWVCPRCRGICNCSFCMKKQGKKPTGILVHTAKATGCASVTEFLKTEGADKYFYQRKVKPVEDVVVASSSLEVGQENVVEQKPVVVKKPKKSKRKELQDMSNGCDGDDVAVKRSKVSNSVPETVVAAEGKTKKTAAAKVAKAKPAREKKEKDRLEEVKLTEGTSSFTISGIDVPPADVGNVLQFLEFCFTFGKALDLRKGQAECVIREMFFRRTTRRQQYSVLTQIMIQILNVILEDRGKTSVSLSATDDGWFVAVGEVLLESGVKLDSFRPKLFEKGLAAYGEIDSSERLKLLNFLCDEALGTTVLRNCIDNIDAKEKLNAAKEKEKQVKQKLQDELAKAVMENNGIPLTIEKRDTVISQMHTETEEARFEILTAMGMLSKKSEGYNDAVRTNPVERDNNGRIIWKLKCYNEEPNILVQDLGNWSEGFAEEKWSTFSSEMKPEIEKYISFLRMKRRQAKKNSEKQMVKNADSTLLTYHCV